MGGMEHTEWFQLITKGDPVREVARRASIPGKTLANQVNAGTLKPENIIKIAEAYNESPVYALVDLGFISARWVNEPGTITALSRATDEQLTDELLRRLNLIADEPVDDLAARRSNTPPSDVEPLPYAANRRPLEPEEGDDDYGPGA